MSIEKRVKYDDLFNVDKCTIKGYIGVDKV
jgi:hypothetical protein